MFVHALWQAPWTSGAIHDTVAAIAREPAYATPLRQSLLGRLFRYIVERIADVVRALGGSRDARITVIVAVAAVVLVIVARLVVSRRLDANRARRGVSRRGGVARRDYWTLARELAAAGDHLAACHALYLAVVDGLAQGGAVRFHPSKTSGDYARELRRRSSPAAPGFGAFAREFDRLAFGLAAATADDVARLAAAAEQLARTSAAA